MSNYRTEKCCLECRHNATQLCDADDVPCRYYDGYVKGKADAIEELKKFVDEKLDMRFALDILCKQVIREYIQLKEQT